MMLIKTSSLVLLWCAASELSLGETGLSDPDAVDSAAVTAAADAGSEPLAELNEEVAKLTQNLGDWSEQARLIDGVLNNLWTKNGWNNESDQYARQAASRISRIPPWKFRDRMDALTQTVRERYTLDDGQVQQFQQRLYQEIWQSTMKYGPAMMKSAKEALTTRLKGEAFRPEQVARWFGEFQPVMDDWQQDILRMTDDIGALMTPQQREIFEKDLESLNKRLDYVIRSSEAWRNGQWRPEDWGLQDDPVHQAAFPSPANLSRPASNRGALAYDESTWARYVREYIKAYQLDQAQQQACEAVLEDMMSRAQRYRSTHADDLRKLTPTQGFVHPLLQPIRSMFAELKARLETLPTEEQRRRATG